jgi:peptidoglycan/LPS O-acetylase OafA/YrhL
MAIVMHHFTSNSGRRELFASAAVGVEFFFCLGGFVVAAAHQDKLLSGMRFSTYARRRIARLYPMYAVGLLLGIVVILLLKQRALTDLTWQGIAAAAMLNSLFLPYLNDAYVQVLATRIVGPIFPFNGPAWSLFFLPLANAVYALTVRVRRGAPLVWLALSGAALCIAAAVYGETPGWGSQNFLGGFPRVFFSFFAGVAIYQSGFRFVPKIPAPAIFAFTIALFAMPRFAGHKFYWLFGSFVVIPIVVSLGARCQIDPESWLRPACLYAGRVSYPIYCTHYPIMTLMPLIVPSAAGPLVSLGGFLAASLIAAHFSMRYVETPVRRWIAASDRDAT